MQEQLDLIDFPEPDGFGIPNDGEPLFWIKEMRVLSKMCASADSLIRTVKFRTGLNVVWSPPTDNEPIADQRLSGHASGKTIRSSCFTTARVSRTFLRLSITGTSSSLKTLNAGPRGVRTSSTSSRPRNLRRSSPIFVSNSMPPARRIVPEMQSIERRMTWMNER